MKINFMSATFRYLGVASIIIFCTLSMFFSFIERDIEDPAIKKAISYASFFENRFFDYRANIVIKDHKINNDITLVRIDDEAIQSIGIYPFPRTVYANFLDNLKKMGAKTVVFDVLYPERALACETGDNNPDNVFARAIANFQSEPGKSVILPYTVADHPSLGFKEMPEELFNFIMDTQQAGEVGLNPEYVSNETWPIKELTVSNPGLGHLNHQEDSDGVFRHYHLASNFDSLYLPSMGLLAFQNFREKIPKLIINLDGSALLKIDENELPVNNHGEVKIRYHGGDDKFKSLSLKEVLSGEMKQERINEFIKNKIIFLGSTAVGAHDLRNTPVDAKLPGVYFHMNLVHMLDNAYNFQKVEDSIYFSLLILALGTIVLLIFQRFDKPLLDVFGVVAVISITLVLDAKYFVPNGYELRIFFTLNSFIFQYVWDTFINFYQSNKDKKQIKGAFSRYVSPAVVNEMLGDPENLKVGGKKIDVTCMFSDVRDFTTISETLSAEDLGTCLNQYMGRMTDLVFEYQGTLDKYIGDAVVALWGAPVQFENHPQKAVESAIAMINSMPAINAAFREQGYPEFKVGIGLNSGEMSVGNMGSSSIFSYTALGDHMNLGARIEGMCKPYGAQILVSEYTFARLDKDTITCRPIDKVRVKGKTKPVELYEVFHDDHPYLKDTASYHEFIQAYNMFHNKQFKEALAIFDKLFTKYADVPSERLKGYCEGFIAEPPGDEWDGVITFTTK